MPSDSIDGSIIAAFEAGGTLSFGDLLKFQYAHCYRRAWWVVLPIILVTPLSVLLMVAVSILNSDPVLVRDSWPSILFLLAFSILITTTPYRGARMLRKTNVNLSAPINYTFSAESIGSKGKHYSSEISYEAIWVVRETKTLFLLYNSAASALVLPKRFFKDSIHQSEWRSFLERRIAPKGITTCGFLGRWL